MAKETSFLGTGWGFPPTFDKTEGKVEVVSNERDIKESLHILLTTRVGERIMHPRYGCNMDKLLFEPLNTTLQTYMQDLVRTAILYYEPRIILHKVSLEPEPEEGRVMIDVEFTIAGTNTRYNFVYPFYQDEGIKDLP
jgi:phage baseplate assembly protein W